MLAEMIARLLPGTGVVAIRGATTVDGPGPQAIEDAVSELLAEVRRRNALRNSDVISALFTVTPDLVGLFPAEVARRAGWEEVPMLCATEIAVPGALARCVRVLLHVARSRNVPPRHVYLRDAARLRPDLTGTG